VQCVEAIGTQEKNVATMQHLDRYPRRGNNIHGNCISLLIIMIKIDRIVRIDKDKYVRLPVNYEYVM